MCKTRIRQMHLDSNMQIYIWLMWVYAILQVHLLVEKCRFISDCETTSNEISTATVVFPALLKILKECFTTKLCWVCCCKCDVLTVAECAFSENPQLLEFFNFLRLYYFIWCVYWREYRMITGTRTGKNWMQVDWEQLLWSILFRFTC